MVVAIRMAWPYHKLRIKQKHQWKLARSWLLILLLLLFRIRPLVFNNDASNSASFLLKQERVNLLGPFHVQLSLRTRAISRYQQPTFSLLFDGNNSIKCNAKRKKKCKLWGEGKKSTPHCCGSGNSQCFCSQRVQTKKWEQAELENANQLVVAGKPSEGKFPALCPCPILCSIRPSSLLQHLMLQGRKSIRSQEMVRTELNSNLLSPF